MTRSQRIGALETLEQFFNQTNDEDQTFYNALSDTIQSGEGTKHENDIMRKIVTGAPDHVSAPKRFAEHLSGFVRIYCGEHRDDYVWHVEHASIRRPWRTSNERIIFIIATIMQECLPDVEAKIWPPASDWELRTITFKAMGLATMWNFGDADVERINNKLFEALNPLV